MAEAAGAERGRKRGGGGTNYQPAAAATAAEAQNDSSDGERNKREFVEKADNKRERERRGMGEGEGLVGGLKGGNEERRGAGAQGDHAHWLFDPRCGALPPWGLHDRRSERKDRTGSTPPPSQPTTQKKVRRPGRDK